MSGGSLDYICYRVGELADTIQARAENPVHRAFADHLRKVEKALHDLEWVWSGDYGKGDETPAIMAVISQQAVIDSAIADANTAMENLKAAIAGASK